MAESIESIDFYNMMPTRQERMNAYFGDQMSLADREAAHGIAMDFEDLEHPMQRTAVLIPVAAHQDAGYIFHTMGEYAKQRNCEPFTVFLHLNAPLDGYDKAAVEKSQAEVARAIEAFPNLDIRSTTTHYTDPVIGEIRRDLWNGAALLAHHEGLFSTGVDDVIGISHDIDNLFISPHYIARIQQYYKLRQANANRLAVAEAPLPAIATRVSHGVLPTHPNVGRVTQWMDNSYFQAPRHTAYEAGIVIPFSHYARRGGFNAADRMHETEWTYRNDHLRYLAGAQLLTSPRRFIDRLDEHGTRGIWLPGSFGAQDNCRDTLGADISFEKAEDLILERLHRDVTNYWLKSGFDKVFRNIEFVSLATVQDAELEAKLHDHAKELVNAQLGKAERFLEKVVGSELLANILRDSIDGDDYAEQQVQSLLSTARYCKT